MNNRLLIAPWLACLLFGPAFSFAEAKDDVKAETKVGWRKIQLSDKFYGEGAAVGDFNHDGVSDVVSGPYWYEGPDFKNKHEIYPAKPFDPHGYSKNFLEFTYDFKGDGYSDVLVIGFPGEEASWYENPRGKGDQWVRHVVFDHVDTESPMFADVLGDGKPVILCATGGKLGYVKPDWSDPAKPWTFHPITPKGAYQRFTHGIGFGDIVGNGKNAILEAHAWWEQPASLEGDPEWKRHEAEFGPAPAQMHVYDVNGDGKNDVVTSLNAHAFGLAWFEQKRDAAGNITWDKHLIMGDKASENPQGLKFSQLHAVEMIDIDGDGLKDIVTGKRFWAHTTDPEANEPAVLYWFQLVRDGRQAHFVAHLIDDHSGVGTEVTTSPLHGNGDRPALIVGNKRGTFVFIQQGG